MNAVEDETIYERSGGTGGAPASGKVVPAKRKWGAQMASGRSSVTDIRAKLEHWNKAAMVGGVPTLMKVCSKLPGRRLE